MAKFKTNCEAPRVAPVSIMAGYVTAIEAGASADGDPLDAASISSDRVLERSEDGNSGTTIVASAVYDAATTAIGTQPKVVLLGRYVDGSATEEAWRVLRNKAGNVEVEITCSITADAEDGLYRRTAPDLTVQAWDTMGCNRFKFAYDTLGVFTDAVVDHSIEAKIL